MDTTATAVEAKTYDEGYARGTEMAERRIASRPLTDLIEDRETFARFSPPDEYGRGIRKAVIDLIDVALETL